MKNLYKYLRESLLDDFDDISNAQDDDLVKTNFETIDKLSKVLGRGYRQGITYSTYDKEEASDYSKIEDGVLKLCTCIDYDIKQPAADLINQLKTVKEFDEIWATNSLCLDFKHVDDSFAKTINTYHGSLRFGYKVEDVSNLNINTQASASETNKRPALISNGYDITFNNCKICNKMTNSFYDNHMFTNNIPVFINCKITGFKEIKIYNTFGVRDAENKDFCDMFDETHKVTFDINGKITTKKATLKNVCAIVNNHKKYHPTNFRPENEGDLIFKINPKFKLEDLINIKCFDKNLKHIEIVDNNVGILFYKQDGINSIITNLKISDIAEHNSTTLPNNKSWKVAILKRL